jgi:hypothetical protein
MNQQGFNQGFNQGFQQSVNQAQLNRIHQNSLYGGASQFDNAQVQRIQQSTISGEEFNPLRAGFGGGFGAQQSISQGYGAQQGFNQGYGAQQGFSQGYGAQQGFNQGVSQAQLNQIHQNSIFNGASQSDLPQVQRIHQNTISGEESNPLRAGFGGGFGAQQSFSQGNGAQQGFSQGYGAQQGFNQGVSQAQLNQIQQNSLFGGSSQSGNAQVQRIHQNTINPNAQGMGMSMNMGMGGMNQGGAFRTVMNADAGIRDAEGPDQYPASMFRGNQFDNVNQSVLNQMSQLAGQFGRQF